MKKLDTRRAATIGWSAGLILTIAVSLIAAVVSPTIERKAEDGVTSAHRLEANASTVKLLAYNVNRCDKQKHCLDEIAGLFRHERPDIVLLADILYQCDSCEIGNQVEYLARTGEMHAYAFGENFRLGFSWLQNRERIGNAILSRFPLDDVRSQSLDTTRLRPRRNRRALWAAIEIAEQRVLVASLHNNASDPTRNFRQMQQILGFTSRPAIIGGDLNAQPDSAPIRLLLEGGRLSGDVADVGTFPSHAPAKRLDYIFAPSDWSLVDHRIVEIGASDHLPVVSTFEIPTVLDVSSEPDLSSFD